MAGYRKYMTARVVPLGADQSDNSTADTTAVERLDMLAQLSQAGWALTGRPTPGYSRATIPVVVRTLDVRGDASVSG